MSNFTESWMSHLDGNKKLTELTIPGTHDSGTYTVSGGIYGGIAGMVAKCQTISILHQLEAGIRFLDIRLKRGRDADKDHVLWVYHGGYACDLTLGGDVLDVCRDFLKKNDKEVIIMSVKDENDPDDNHNKDKFYDDLVKAMNDRPGLFYTQDAHKTAGITNIPALQDTRGKIVLLRRFGLGSKTDNIGLDAYDQWPKGKEEKKEFTNYGIRFYVQDAYKDWSAGAGHLKKKFTEWVKPTMDLAAGNTMQDTLFINFTSAGQGVYPVSMATGYMIPGFDGVNEMLAEHLRSYTRSMPTRFGIIPMDFPESAPYLIQKLIGCNFPPFSQRIFDKATAFANEEDGTWTMANYDTGGIFGSVPDLVFIKTANTPSGKAEVHVASGMTAYQKITYAQVTAFNNETEGTWLMASYNKSFPGIPNSLPDLVYIKTANTSSGKTEVHIASGASGYQKIVFSKATVFNHEAGGAWLMVNYDQASIRPDLVFIKTGNTSSGKVEVHIASGRSDYQTMLLQAATTFDCDTHGIWTMADWDGSGIPDLVFIKTDHTASGLVEVHIASGASGYQTRILACKTAFAHESNGTWLMRDFNRNHIQDLIFIKTSHTPSNHVEVHVASGATS